MTGVVGCRDLVKEDGFEKQIELDAMRHVHMRVSSDLCHVLHVVSAS